MSALLSFTQCMHILMARSNADLHILTVCYSINDVGIETNDTHNRSALRSVTKLLLLWLGSDGKDYSNARFRGKSACCILDFLSCLYPACQGHRYIANTETITDYGL